VTVRQRWSQEPQGFDREAILKLPQVLPTDGKKLPLVVDLHGNGGQGNVRRLNFLGDSAVLLAPNGYQRSWNVYNEKSKADDVSFILDLITKVVEENPVVNRSEVTIMGTSNGAAMIYRLLLETDRDRPFRRVIPIASSLISVQHHENQFWKSESGSATDHSMPVQPQFDDDFQFLHFHGTDDGTIAYWGKSPGPSFLGANVDVLPAQRSPDFSDLLKRRLFSGRISSLHVPWVTLGGSRRTMQGRWLASCRFTPTWPAGSNISSTSAAPTETPLEMLR